MWDEAGRGGGVKGEVPLYTYYDADLVGDHSGYVREQRCVHREGEGGQEKALSGYYAETPSH